MYGSNHMGFPKLDISAKSYQSVNMREMYTSKKEKKGGGTTTW